MIITQVIAFALLLLIVGGFTFALYYAIFYVPYVPTPYKIVRKMIEAAGIKSEDTVYDLGCGDGRIPMECAKKGAKATGFEIAWPVYLWAKINAKIQRSKIKILRKNFMTTPLNDADHVFCYLWPKLMRKLVNKFENELKKGTKIISYSFPIKEWEPIKKVPTIEGNNQTFLIYVYEIGTSNIHKTHA